MNIIKEQKNAIRAKYKAKRRSMDVEVKKKSDLAICKKVTELASYRYADTLLAYFPLTDEIDIIFLINEALNQGKKVAFPRCDISNNTMTYHYIESLDSLKRGTMGIYEPDPSFPIYSTDSSFVSPALCLVPALVYDKKGYRLGYGKGYYDRFLPKFKGAKIGLIYSDFIVDAVPKGKFDLSVDVLITEKGVKTTNAD